MDPRLACACRGQGGRASQGYLHGHSTWLTQYQTGSHGKAGTETEHNVLSQVASINIGDIFVNI
jgi:hypothetical protein